MSINSNKITVVVQGSVNKDYIFNCLESIKKILPSAKIILSTWENEDIPFELQQCVSKILYNKDPGFKTRNCNPDGKPNNVNRQIVSTINGLKEVETEYALKIRTDFILKSDKFIRYFDKYQKFDEKCKIFKKRIICAMFGTRKPEAQHYNLPFHVADFFYFGLTSDLINLFDIPLVTDEEFEWFINHTEFMPNTNARNKYNAEQSIWINCLQKNNIKVKCKYSTHVNNEIKEQSEKYLVNNFYPVAFAKAGVLPQKTNLKSKNHIPDYSDYYTQKEWLQLYGKYCDNSKNLHHSDVDRVILTLSTSQ